MNKFDIFHIYHGTQGTAGLYIDEIYHSLKKKYTQKLFLNHYYPFDYGEKVFFRRSTISKGIKYVLLRRIIKYLELILGLIYTSWHVMKHKPRVINYSMISMYAPERLFLRLIKLLHDGKLVITCHDVIPFSSKVRIFDSEMKKRKRYFEMADFLLVHNNNSINELINIYNIPKTKVLYHPFPIMDLKKMGYEYNKEKLYDFAFVGVVRKSKGINVLLEAWTKFISEYTQGKLLIAGILAGEHIDVAKYQSKNVSFNFKYLNDYEYCKSINSAKCVILPYLRGTNSGIPSSILSLGVDIIASDIPMFKNNPLIPEESLFKSESIDSLYALIKAKYLFPKEITNRSIFFEYRVDFDKQVLYVYDSLLESN